MAGWIEIHPLGCLGFFFFMEDKGNTSIPVRLISLCFTFCKDRSKQTAALFMTQEEIVAVLEEKLSDCPEEILSELAEHLVR